MDMSTSKKILLVTGIIFSIVFLHALFFKTVSSRSEERMPTVSIPPEGPIVVQGKMVCLPHKNTGGVQTLECAYGLQDREGRYFGLSDTNPNYENLISAPLGVPVTVTGVFGPHDDSLYQDIGIIVVKTVVQTQSL